MTIVALTCPMCGGQIKHRQRVCDFCGSSLIVVSTQGITSQSLKIDTINQAMEKFRSILKEDKTNVNANYNLGIAYLNQGLLEPAIKHLRIATKNAPEIPEIHYNLAIALFNDGEGLTTQELINEFNKELEYAITLDTSFNEAIAFKHYFLGFKLQTVDWAEAAKEYKKATVLCPDVPVFYNNLGFALINSKQYTDAEIALLKSIKLDPNQVYAFSNLCHCYYLTNRFKEGLTTGEKAISNIKTSTNIQIASYSYNNYSLCLYKSGQKEKAKENIKKAIAIWPQNQICYDNLKVIDMRKYTVKDFVLTVVISAVLFTLLCLIFIR